MTQERANKLIKIAKYILIFVFAVFFVIITIQSINISSLKSKKNSLENSLAYKETINTQYNNEINNIEENFDNFSEEELRKEDYIKPGEDFFG